MRIAFYTSTMGGGGHIATALSIQRGLARAGFSGEYRIFGPAMPYRGVDMTHYVEVELSPAERLHKTLARNSRLARLLSAWRPDLVLVDKFWHPIRHILPMLSAPAWLLLHWVPPGWFLGPPAARDSDPFAPYSRILGIEPLPHFKDAEQIGPVVVCNPDECMPTDALKRRLGVDPDAHLTLVVQTGQTGDELKALQERYGQRPGEVVMALSMHQGEPIFPVAPWLPGADRIIGGAGYGFIWETVWLGLTERTTYHPFPRDIDDQFWRARVMQRYVMRRNGADVLAELILRGG